MRVIPRGNRRRRLVRQLLGLAAVTAVCGLAVVPAPSAVALPADGNGNYTQILCADPTSQEGVGIPGMPEGLSNPASADTWQITTSQVDCANGLMTAGRGVPMAVGLGASYPQGTWAALLYQAPANITVNGGAIYRAERAEGPDNGFMGIDQQGGEYDTLYSLPRNPVDEGDWYAGNIASRGTFVEPFSPANFVNLTISPDGGHWDVNATCDPNGNNNSSCTLSAGQWEYRLFGGEVSLNASQDPQASNISGALTSEDPLTGSEPITFSATDQGPGLAYVKMIVDGSVVQSEIADRNSGRCVPIAGTGPYTWAYQVPCKTSLGGRTYSLDTTAIANGEHHIQVVIEDAAGNRSVVLDRTVGIENATQRSASSAVLPSAESLAAPAQFATPNGVGASEAAQLRLQGATHRTRAFAQRALTISGRLSSGGGTAIGDASLNVTEQAQGSAATVIGEARTASNGTFTVHVAAGPSRVVTIGYRAVETDPTYAAQATVSESVEAGVQMHVSPRRTAATGTIQIIGQVAGPIPREGVLVELLVHYRGAWVPFRAPRTTRSGRFSTSYQFQGASGRFPFRAEIPASQAGFPYATGYSSPVTVASG